MMKLIIPLMSLFFILNKPRFWTLFSSSTLIMALMSIMLFPTFHMSATTSIFYNDSLSSPLITLTLWIFTLMVLSSQKINIMSYSPKKFIFLLTALMISLVITFSINNLISFYIFFETSLIPTFLLILGWGYQPERLQASMYLLMYTIIASLPLLLMILTITQWNKTTFMFKTMYTPNLSPNLLKMWWLMMLMAFMVKMPLYSVHLWLPKAHVEAPVAGSMVLAAILLKLGSYALIRTSNIFIMMNMFIKPLFASVAMIGAVFTSMICLRQTDLKALIAYSSVGHMGLLIAASITNLHWGWQGSLILMISHGLTSSALFAMANTIYEVTQTRSLFLTKGLLSIFPAISLFFFILSATNMAAPPSINLLGEISMITPTLAISKIMAIPLAMLAFLGGAYSLHLYTSVNHGQPSLFSNPSTLLINRNLLIPLLHSIPSMGIILKMDIINPWL